jgi:hypothetical protein
MISKKIFEDILCKYPELIEPGYAVKGRNVDLYGQQVDILMEDKFKKRLIVQVRTTPIENTHVGEIISHQEEILSGEASDISVMLVADKVPGHLQTTLEHSGVAWKEVTTFHIKEHLNKAGDAEMLKLLEQSPRG